MKKKTSIFLFKLWVLPPVIMLGSYFIIGLTMTALGLDGQMLRVMHAIAESHGSAISTVYYAYVVVFFVQLLMNIPFIASIIYFKGGLAQIAGEEFTGEMVRQSHLMFWDEIVSKYSLGEAEQSISKS